MGEHQLEVCVELLYVSLARDIVRNMANDDCVRVVGRHSQISRFGKQIRTGQEVIDGATSL